MALRIYFPFNFSEGSEMKFSIISFSYFHILYSFFPFASNLFLGQKKNLNKFSIKMVYSVKFPRSETLLF